MAIWRDAYVNLVARFGIEEAEERATAAQNIVNGSVFKEPKSDEVEEAEPSSPLAD